jgi:cysteine-rich repeat protein
MSPSKFISCAALSLAIASSVLGAACAVTTDDGSEVQDEELITFPAAAYTKATKIAYGTTTTQAFTHADTYVAVKFTGAKGDVVRFSVSAPRATVSYLVFNDRNVSARRDKSGPPGTYRMTLAHDGDHFIMMRTRDRQDAAITVKLETPAAVCGNGVRDGAEECDDGNAMSKDGCSPPGDQGDCPGMILDGCQLERKTYDGTVAEIGPFHWITGGASTGDAIARHKWKLTLTQPSWVYVDAIMCGNPLLGYIPFEEASKLAVCTTWHFEHDCKFSVDLERSGLVVDGVQQNTSDLSGRVTSDPNKLLTMEAGHFSGNPATVAGWDYVAKLAAGTHVIEMVGDTAHHTDYLTYAARVEVVPAN